jgi:hypothetical protein
MGYPRAGVERSYMPSRIDQGWPLDRKRGKGGQQTAYALRSSSVWS